MKPPKGNTLNKICEACGSSFTCQVNDIKNCFCSKIFLAPEVLQQIKTKFQHCLCETCLSRLKKN